jgi:hypothetical protein
MPLTALRVGRTEQLTFIIPGEAPGLTESVGVFGYLMS